jgi:hypothetical protein
MEKTWCVYKHTSPDGRSYIGIAQEPAKIRWSNGKGYKDNPVFWKCICDVGWENIRHEILHTGLDKHEALKLETKLIKELETLVPHGFNRRWDNPRVNSIKHKVEIGNKRGFSVVLNYWPDKEGYKVYELECECGNVFVCKGRDITDDLSCGCRKEVS